MNLTAKDIVAEGVSTFGGMRRSIHCNGNAIKRAANPDQVITSFAQKLAGRQRRHERDGVQSEDASEAQVHPRHGNTSARNRRSHW
jgi:hypothetical protein